MDSNRHIPPDVLSVLRATALLDITEYELFGLAWLRWNGERPEEGVLEPFFVAYMFDAVVPPWVRAFARTVERLSREGCLDRRALGVGRLPESREMVTRGMRYGVTIGLVLAALVIFVEFMAQVMQLGGCPSQLRPVHDAA